MQRFSQFLSESEIQFDFLCENSMLLIEKLIQFNQGRQYGQIVFLAGGAGSGKGFAKSNFLDDRLFKTRDVDEWKKAFMFMSKDSRYMSYHVAIHRDRKGKMTDVDVLKNLTPKLEYGSDVQIKALHDLKLREPEDVSVLHMAVKQLGIKNKTLDLLFQDMKADRLPNIIFDITLKDMEDITEVIPRLKEAGYQAKNIHIVWVLADYHVAVHANKTRERVVDDKILLKTHEGAANTMYDIIRSKQVPGLDGSIHVILNNRDQTVFWELPDGTKTDVIKGFTYLTLKREGKPFEDEQEVNSQLMDWIKDNIPRTKDTGHIWSQGI